MSPGSDLTAVALPIIPQGHRWVIDKRKVRESSWGDTFNEVKLCITLEKQRVTMFGNVKWDEVDKRSLIRTMKANIDDSVAFRMETLVECAERLAADIIEKHTTNLKRLLEEESLIGIYEPRQNKALS